MRGQLFVLHETNQNPGLLANCCQQLRDKGKVTKEGNAVKPSSWEFEGSRREISFVAASSISISIQKAY